MNILAIDTAGKKLRINGVGRVYEKNGDPCIEAICPTCKKDFWARIRYRKSNPKKHQIFCSRICFFRSDKYKPPCHKAGKNHPSYKKGYCMSRGYKIISSGKNAGKAEHRVIAEKILGRKLKRNEAVHHINGNKSDNRNENLLICSVSYHSWIEAKMAYLYKQEHIGGDSN